MTAVSPDNRGAESRDQSPQRLFAGRGMMRARCREFDWASTALGPVESWPQTLRTTAATVLGIGFPAILLCGPELVHIYNDAYIRFLGVKHPAALGMPTFECWPEVRHITEPIYARVRAGETVANEDQVYSLENAGADAPPEDVFVTISFSPVGEPGAVDGVLVTIIDTTREVERRNLHAEREHLVGALETERRRLSEMFRRAPSFIALLRGPDQQYEFINEAYGQIIGHRDVIGKPLLEALPEIRGQGFKELLDHVRESGESWIGNESPVELQRTPGAPTETRYLNMVFQPYVEADGSRSGVIAHGSDVTDQVLARRELEHANELLKTAAVELEAQATELRQTSALRDRAIEAEAANRAKMEFLTIMSHELRTPLNAIGGYAELLRIGVHGPVTVEQVTALDRIERSQRHLLGLIQGILNYARLDAGALSYAIEDVRVDDLLSTCEDLVAPQVATKGLSLTCRGLGSAVSVRADRDKAQQIIINLLGNAIKFTDAPGRIEIACSADDRFIEIRVTDTGRGIAPEQLLRVFEPFVQVDTRFTRSSEGLGLGLAISRDLARAMGGDLVAQSEIGVGSTFTLRLPSATADAR